LQQSGEPEKKKDCRGRARITKGKLSEGKKKEKGGGWGDLKRVGGSAKKIERKNEVGGEGGEPVGGERLPGRGGKVRGRQDYFNNRMNAP